MKNSTTPLRACIATSLCSIPEDVWELGLPGSLTVHLIAPVGLPHRATSSWLHDALVRRSIDCSDVTGDRGVWSLRPFDPQPFEGPHERDAEVLLVLADLARMAQGKKARRVLPACTSPVGAGLAKRGVRMEWHGPIHGSYERDPPTVELGSLLRELSPYTAVVLGGGTDASASAEASASESHVDRARFYLRKHGVPHERVLALPSLRAARRARERDGARRVSGPVATTRRVLRFASELVERDILAAMRFDGLLDNLDDRLKANLKIEL